MNSPRKAAILLIGNELLSGRVRDENLPFLASELWRRGIRVARAAIVRDDAAEIAAAVQTLAPAHDFVITTGGIGPTHDDVTVAGVAQAFGVPVVQDPRLAAMIEGHLGDRATAAHLRMARVPEGAELAGGPGSGWPVIRYRNVFLLPGIPELVRRKFEAIADLFSGRPIHRRELRLIAEEAEIAEPLDALAAENPALEIGSYPDGREVLVTIEGASQEAVERALARLARLAEGRDRPG